MSGSEDRVRLATDVLVVAAIQAAEDATQAASLVESASTLFTDLGSVSGTVDLSETVLQPFVHATLVGDVEVELPVDPPPGRTITLVLTQDGTGGRTLTVPEAVVSFAVPVTLSADPGATDRLHLVFDGAVWVLTVWGLDMGIPVGGVI